MFTQCRLIQALRYATFVLFVALCFKGLKRIAFLHLSGWQSFVAASLLCVSTVLLLTFWFRWSLNFKTAVGNTNADIVKTKAFDPIAEGRRN